ncbi:MAG: hypothetical protein CL678_00240 [Bdellovibrionaceae bacterium]|nr:hypothetical protein [Pseudobdellovibrionaceae bacterium]|tara:strand:+ start:2609 stop:4111 length:1503 start_codon:yes stop_codon:yes gene_type:complete
MTDSSFGPKPEIHGLSKTKAYLNTSTRLGIKLFETWPLVVLYSIHLNWDGTPFPSSIQILVGILITIGFHFLCLCLFKKTLIQWIWKTQYYQVDTQTQESKPSQWPQSLLLYLKTLFLLSKNQKIVELQKPGASSISSLFISLGIFVLIAMSIFPRLNHHPLLIPIDNLPLEAFAPSEIEGDQTLWTSVPFFYTSGAWPLRFKEKTFIYSMPYQQGPPQRFIPRIKALWQAPNIRLLIEGPKTPLGLKENELLKPCLLGGSLAKKIAFAECLKIREKTLIPPLEQMKAVGLRNWKISWFEVQNEKIPETIRPRGIYMQANHTKRGQDRYIFVNSVGVHQSVSLDYPLTPDGEQAREIFKKSMRSMRVSDQLTTGRALVNRRLAAIKLKGTRSIKNSIHGMEKMIEIITLLISKVSVEPKSFDAFYHLGGTASILARQADSARVSRSHIFSADQLLLLNEWTAISKPMIQIALKYATDVSPGNPKLKNLENLWIEAVKREQ